MSDKEIALKLTESYIEHLNIRVNKGALHAHVNEENIAVLYKYFYRIISELPNASN